MEQSTSTAVH